MGLFDSLFSRQPSPEKPSPPSEPHPDPVIRWQRQLEQVQQRMEDLHYAEAAELLTDLLIDIGRLQGSAVDAYLPVAFGSLGECYFQGGQADRAIKPTRQALEIVTRTGDFDGMAAYLGNLYEIHRYLGQSAPAADCAERLATLAEQQGRSDQAVRYRKQAHLVRAGEPLNRVVVEMAGQRYELAEVLEGGKVGSVRFHFERNRITLRPARVFLERGGKEASEGHFDEALDFFREAARADRFDPHSLYQGGLTLLYLQRYPEAIECYEGVEERAPGWFHCRSDLWLARQLMLGKVSDEVFRIWHAVEDGPFDPERKIQMAGRGLTLAPNLALLHHLLGKNARARGLIAQAETAYRRGLACAEEPDIQTRLLVELGVIVSSVEEKRRLLQQAIALQGNLVAAATATLVLAFE
jgi:tetratricopeptide (TPR) repeat protein